MTRITPQQLRDLADGLANQNHEAERVAALMGASGEMLAVLKYAKTVLGVYADDGAPEVIQAVDRVAGAIAQAEPAPPASPASPAETTEPYLLLLDDQTAVKIGGTRFDGWLFRKHPDGQWISVRKLEREDLE